MESWFKVGSRLVVEDPANWSKSHLGILSELTHEALMMFLFLKVAGNFRKKTTFRVSRNVLDRVAAFRGNGDVDNILTELETCNLIKVDDQNFTLTDTTAAAKVEAPRELDEPAYTPKPHLTDEEQRAKAFAGLCDFDELIHLGWEDIITEKELNQLQDEHKYIGEGPVGSSTETKK
jgi:predicted phosphodiesterase